MKKFEYNVIRDILPLDGFQIQDLGLKGWELVVIIKGRDEYYHYFKREK